MDVAEAEGEVSKVDAVVGAAVLEDAVVVERPEVAVAAENDVVEAAVAGVVLEGVAADVIDVAVDNALACGAASAVAAKSRIRAVGFILLNCCMIGKCRS